MKVQHKNKFLEIFHERGRAMLKRVDSGKCERNDEKYMANDNLQDSACRKGYKRTTVTSSAFQIEYQLSIYQWRAKTNHPLLLSTCVGVQFGNESRIFRKRDEIVAKFALGELDMSQTVRMQVETQISEPLLNYMPLPFSQHLYSLKESVYGFEQLHSYFGQFHIDPTVIRVNSQRKIKVWASNPLDSNPQNQRQNPQQAEQYLLKQIVAFFFRHRQNTSIFRQFYEGAHVALTFLQLVKYIDGFIEKHKIKIDKKISSTSRNTINRAQSPKNNMRRVPKFLSPTAIQNQFNNASARFSVGNIESRRQPLNSQSFSKKQSLSLKKTSQTQATDHKINLVRTDKHRKGSGNNFCFTSLHKLEVAHENLKTKSKASQICFDSDQLNGQYDTMVSVNAEESLLRNFDKLFDQQSQIDYLSVSINLDDDPLPKKAVKLKKLSNYGRAVNESIINSPSALRKR